MRNQKQGNTTRHQGGVKEDMTAKKKSCTKHKRVSQRQQRERDMFASAAPLQYQRHLPFAHKALGAPSSLVATPLPSFRSYVANSTAAPHRISANPRTKHCPREHTSKRPYGEARVRKEKHNVYKHTCIHICIYTQNSTSPQPDTRKHEHGEE